jgi:NodT family efflux transporter outer membrane factor (OMF) lipoprotein
MRAMKQTRTRVLSKGPLLVGMALLSGCALKTPPDTEALRQQQVPALVGHAAWVAPTPAAVAAVKDGWIAGFNDPELNRLVAEAIANNRDLLMASARVEQAKALSIMNGAARYPSVYVKGVSGNTDTEILSLGAAWELDFWGRVRSQARAAKSQYEASQSDYRWAEQSLAAGVANAWFSLIELSRIIERTEQAVAAQEGLLKIAKQRTKTGISPETDVEEADSRLRELRSDLAAMQLSRTQAAQALEVLLGRYPADALRTVQDLPDLSPVPVDVPANLLERRPDLVAAEQRVAAAFDLKQSADAARLPSISISAAITDISSDIFLLNSANSPIRGGSLSFLAPLFSGGYLKAQSEYYSALQREAAAAYGSAALSALKEVEGSLRAEASLASQAGQQAASLAQQRELLRKEEVRVRVGSRDPRSVLQRQQSMLTADIAYQQIRADQARQRVALLMALGGSWNASPAPAAP